MIIRKTLLLSVLIMIAALSKTHAQFGMGKIEEIEAVQSRKLIVMIEEPKEKMIKKIQKNAKRGSVEDYKADLKTYNATMKEVIEKFWPYTKKDISYKTYDEIEKLKKEKNKDYAVLFCCSVEAKMTEAGYNFEEGLLWVKNIKEDFEDAKRVNMMFTQMMVNTIEDFGKAPVYQVPLFDIFPTKAAIAYGMQTMKNYFDMRVRVKKEGGKMKDERELVRKALEENAPKLKDKTLLIRNEWLDKELTESSIKTHYPYKYKICDRSEMDSIVMLQDENYAYGVVLPYVSSTSYANSVIYVQYVFDGADSKMMAYVPPMMLAGNFAISAGSSNFTFKVLDKIVEQINGKKP